MALHSRSSCYVLGVFRISESLRQEPEDRLIDGERERSDKLEHTEARGDGMEH